MAAVKFEYAMARLETIVAEPLKGDLLLDDSLKIFEEGSGYQTCSKMLKMLSARWILEKKGRESTDSKPFAR